MVARVYGKIDGVDIILSEKAGKWIVPVPIKVDGVYIVEIIAEDTAGNSTYLAEMVFVVNKTVVETYLISLDYRGVLVDPYNVGLLDTPFSGEFEYDLNGYLTDSYLVEVVLL